MKSWSHRAGWYQVRIEKKKSRAKKERKEKRSNLSAKEEEKVIREEWEASLLDIMEGSKTQNEIIRIL
jgi:hypothetical protein